MSPVSLYILLMDSNLLDSLWGCVWHELNPLGIIWAPSLLPHWSWDCYAYLPVCLPWLGWGVCWHAQSWLWEAGCPALWNTWIVCILSFPNNHHLQFSRVLLEQNCLVISTPPTGSLWHGLALAWPHYCCRISVFVTFWARARMCFGLTRPILSSVMRNQTKPSRITLPGGCPELMDW